MTVWVVYGDDHDYDAMSQWLVGVYSTKELAEAAAQKDRERYWAENHIPKRERHLPHMEITETVLDGEVK